MDGTQDVSWFGLLSNDQLMVTLTGANVMYCLCRALEILKPPQEEDPNGFATASFSPLSLEWRKVIMLFHIRKMKPVLAWRLSSPTSWKIKLNRFCLWYVFWGEIIQIYAAILRLSPSSSSVFNCQCFHHDACLYTGVFALHSLLVAEVRFYPTNKPTIL